jgi:hypothetical protein
VFLCVYSERITKDALTEFPKCAICRQRSKISTSTYISTGFTSASAFARFSISPLPDLTKSAWKLSVCFPILECAANCSLLGGFQAGCKMVFSKFG